MSMSFIHIHERERSREFRVPHVAVKDGAKLVLTDEAQYRTAVEGTKGILRTFEAASGRASTLLEKLPIGTVIRLEAVFERQVVDVVKFRQLTPKPPVSNTRGVSGIDRFVGLVEAKAKTGEWSDRRFAGICVCKPESDHADCAAVDVFASNEHMEQMRDEALNNAESFMTKYVILFQTIHIVRSDFTHFSKPHTGDFHAHVHVSVSDGIPDSAC
jgi:hypothetical protein